MEGYTSPSPLTPPSLLSLPTQSAPPTLPSWNQSVQPPPAEAKPVLEPPAPLSASKPKPKSHKKKPTASPSNQSKSNQATLKPQAPSKGKKRKGELMEAGPKKSRIVSQEFINTTDKETEAESRLVSKPKSISTTDEESEAESQPVSKPKSKTEVYVDIATKPPSQLRTQADKIEAKPKSKPRPWAQSRQPKLESGSRLKSPPVQKKVSPTTQKRRDEQNAAIQRGEFQLADSPCDTCKRRLN